MIQNSHVVFCMVWIVCCVIVGYCGAHEHLDSEASLSVIHSFVEGLSLFNASNIEWMTDHLNSDVDVRVHIIGEQYIPQAVQSGPTRDRKLQSAQTIDGVVNDLKWQFDIIPDMRLEVQSLVCLFPDHCVVAWLGSGTIKNNTVFWKGGASVGVLNSKISVLGASNRMLRKRTL
eukprot:TRINITY_DN8586_c0_g1_i1.p1 TRINITY_DN8586_c0_g1~~TRINITY_DN8586_c0_g1_i1.p1  ORF type:complete len:174 (-),score=22.26 TRINITY_DN8586_c0_g1_i1:70-591(-)